MIIALAQTKSGKGNIKGNIRDHVRMIKLAVSQNADLIVFPELSITGYEPELAAELATTTNDALFDIFKKLSSEENITIGVGMPINSKEGVLISLLLFRPDSSRMIYSKQKLHVDEEPFFKCGKEPGILALKGKRIAFGICYETLLRDHFLQAKEHNIDIYIASVAKPQGGIEKAYSYFPRTALEFQTPILMSNCIGFCDNFLSTGQSAVWDHEGKLLETLDKHNEGLLLYDTEINEVEKLQVKIEKGTIGDSDHLLQLYINGRNDLIRNGLNQWTDQYPNISIVDKDLRNEEVYLLKFGNEIVGAVTLNEEEDNQYKAVQWEFDPSKVLVIHRLVIEPKYQGMGNARKLMDFSEAFASKNAYSSIRLDAYSKNERVINMYIKRGYHIRGDAYFHGRAHPFRCMEKAIL